MIMMKRGGHITEKCSTMAFEKSCVAWAGADTCKQTQNNGIHAIDYLKSLYEIKPSSRDSLFLISFYTCVCVPISKSVPQSSLPLSWFVSIITQLN